jgi:hypothetical protein
MAVILIPARRPAKAAVMGAGSRVKRATENVDNKMKCPVIYRFIDRELTRLEGMTWPPATTMEVAYLYPLLFKTMRRGSPLALANCCDGE